MQSFEKEKKIFSDLGIFCSNMTLVVAGEESKE